MDDQIQDFTFDSAYDSPAPTDADLTAQQERRELARSAAFIAPLDQFSGRHLHAFSMARLIIYHDLRNALGLPPIAECVDVNGGFIGETARILYLCLHDREHLDGLRTTPQRLQSAIDDWADLNLTPQLSAEADILAIRIWNASQSGHGETDDTGDTLGKPQNASPSPPPWWLAMWHSLPVRLRGQRDSSSGISPSVGVTGTSAPSV